MNAQIMINRVEKCGISVRNTESIPVTKAQTTTERKLLKSDI